MLSKAVKLFAIPLVCLLISSSALAQVTTLYLESNRANRNSILAFQNIGGTLSFLGEFSTEGRGVFDLSLKLGPFDSDQEVTANSEGTVLYAVNSGSDTIAIFRIGATGRLTPLVGSPFPSGGTNPVSVGLARGTLAVVNKAMDASRPSLDHPNYVSFNLASDGAIDAGPLSNESAPVGSSPSQAQISSGKRLVFDAQFLGGHLRSFLVDNNGALTPESFQALPASQFVGTPPPHIGLGLDVHPRKSILYVGFTSANRLGVYTYDATGHLTFVRSVHNSGKAICWIKSNTVGTRLYTSNTFDSSVSVYDITNPLEPVEIQHLKLRGLGNPFQNIIDPRGTWLYVLTQRGSPSIPLGKGNTLHVLRIDPVSGKLSDDDFVSLSLPKGTRPQGLAAVLTH